MNMVIIIMDMINNNYGYDQHLQFNSHAFLSRFCYTTGSRGLYKPSFYLLDKNKRLVQLYKCPFRRVLEVPSVTWSPVAVRDSRCQQDLRFWRACGLDYGRRKMAGQANTQRNKHVIITTKRRFDVITTRLWRCAFAETWTDDKTPRHLLKLSTKLKSRQKRLLKTNLQIKFCSVCVTGTANPHSSPLSWRTTCLKRPHN